MNKIFFQLIVISILIGFYGQLKANNKDNDKSAVQKIDVNGITLIYKPSVKQVISAQLFIKGGTANYTEREEGIEALALQAATQGGTKKHPKTDYFTLLESTGTAISAASEYDYSLVSLQCLTNYWDTAWELYAEAITQPAFDEGEFENIRGQMIAAAKNAQTDPDEHLRNIAMKNVFSGKNYSKIPQGTEESLTTISLESVKRYYNHLIGKDKLLLVVVGDVDLDDLVLKINKAFGNLPAQGIAFNKEEKPIFKENNLRTEKRDIATNYVRGYMAAPSLGSADEIPMRVAMSILSDRYFEEVRTKRNLSYSPYAAFPSSIISNPYTFVYVSTDKPNEAVQVMTDEIRKIHKEGFSETELKNKKGEFLTQYYLKQETNASLATSLGMAELAGDWKTTQDFMQKVNDLDVASLNTVFDKYTNYIKWTYLGDTGIIDENILLTPNNKTLEEYLKEMKEKPAPPKPIRRNEREH